MLVVVIVIEYAVTILKWPTSGFVYNNLSAGQQASKTAAVLWDLPALAQHDQSGPKQRTSLGRAISRLARANKLQFYFMSPSQTTMDRLDDNNDDDQRPGHEGLFTAGFKILDRYHGQWQQLHTKSENNVRLAGQVSQRLDLLDRVSRNRLDALTSLDVHYRSLVLFEKQLGDISGNLGKLETSIAHIEELLSILRARKTEASAMGNNNNNNKLASPQVN